jgi:protocatechuate 3,4-dioxygenase beta subunit
VSRRGSLPPLAFTVLVAAASVALFLATGPESGEVPSVERADPPTHVPEPARPAEGVREPLLPDDEGPRLAGADVRTRDEGDAPASLEGRVVDASTKPVPGATVRLFPAVVATPARWDDLAAALARIAALTRESVSIASARTGEDGRFRIGPPPARGALVVTTAEGYAQDARIVGSATLREALRIALGPEEPVEGHVDEEGGGAVAGVEVVGHPTEGSGFALVTARAVTDERGRFRLSGLPQGVEARVVAGRSGSARVLRGLDPANDDWKDVRLTLPRSAPLRVLAVEDTTGRPVAGATVLVLVAPNPTRTREPRGFGIAVTDESGGAEVLAPLRGPWRIQVESLDGGRGGRTIEAADRQDPASVVEVRVFAQRRIVGRVVDEKERPLEGVSVQAGTAGGAARTGPDGAFRISLPSRLAAGESARIRLWREDRPSLTVLAESTRGDGAVVDLGVLTLPVGHRATVRVLDPGGNPLAGAWVEWKQEPDGPGDARGPLPASGTTEMGMLRKGRLRISAGDDRFVTVVREVLVDDLTEGSTIDVRLVAGLAIEGTVLTLEGEPAAGAYVSTAEKTVEADARGKFRIEGLTSGTHRLRVRWAAEWDVLEAEAGGRPVILKARSATRAP